MASFCGVDFEGEPFQIKLKKGSNRLGRWDHDYGSTAKYDFNFARNPNGPFSQSPLGKVRGLTPFLPEWCPGQFSETLWTGAFGKLAM